MTPIHVICARMKRLPLRLQAEHLAALIAAERPRSIRRAELESLLASVILRQLRKENRAA